MGYAFISYSTKNQSTADAMRALLKKYNMDTWMAPYDIPAGGEYAEVLYEALSGCACLILLLTDAAQSSQWVRKEVNTAITHGKMIIPVQLEEMELNSMMKFYLNDQQIVPVHSIDESNPEMQGVLKRVIGLTGSREEAPAAASEENDAGSNEAASEEDDAGSNETASEEDDTGSNETVETERSIHGDSKEEPFSRDTEKSAEPQEKDGEQKEFIKEKEKSEKGQIGTALTRGCKIWFWLLLIVNALSAAFGLLLIMASPVLGLVMAISGTAIAVGAGMVLFKHKRSGLRIIIAMTVINCLTNIISNVGILTSVLLAVLCPAISYYFVKKNSNIIR